MNKVDGSIQIDNTEDMLFTYDENERQDIEIAKANSQLIYSPKFIPMYLDLLNEYTLTEALLIGFIDFYKSSSGGRMYFTNEQLGSILKCSPDTISRSISKIEKNGLIKTSRKIKAGGGQIRFITECNYNKYSDSTISTSHSRQNLQAGIVENLQTNNNKINNNKINTHSLSSNEDNSFVNSEITNNNIIINNNDIVILDNKEESFVKLNNKDQLVENNNIVELNKKTHEIKQIFESNKKCGCISKSTTEQCLRKASYLIDGKLYCNQHSRDILSDVINNNIKKDIDQGVFEKLWSWYGKKDAKQAAKKYFDKYIKTEYDINLLRYALPKYVESVKDKNYLVLLRTYLCEQRYLDYKEEFDLLNNKGNEIIINNINETKTDDGFKLKFNRNYEN